MTGVQTCALPISFIDGKIIAKIVNDIQYLFAVEATDTILVDTINLWDDKGSLMKHGVSYKEEF